MNGISLLVFQGAAGLFAAGVIYIYVLNRLIKFAQPLRLELAEEGANALRRGELPPNERRFVIFCMKHAYGMWPAVMMSAVFPFIAVWSGIELARRQWNGRSRISSRPALVRITVLFSLSAIAANPLFGVLLAMEFIAFLCIVIFTTGQFEALRIVLASLASVEEWMTAGGFRFAR